jgi:hypothetical protein
LRGDLVLIVAVFVAGLLIVLLTGGDLRRLNGLRMRWPYLAVGAVAAQVAVISLWPRGWHTGHLLVHVGTYLAIGAFFWVNRRIHWLWVVALGTACNLAAIAANGGVMPASAKAMAVAHLKTGPGFANSAPVTHARLAFLGDIIPTPPWLPLHNVASIGDLLIAGGAVLVVACQTRPRRRAAALSPSHPGG